MSRSRTRSATTFVATSLVAVAALGLAGCGDDGDGGGPPLGVGPEGDPAPGPLASEPVVFESMSAPGLDVPTVVVRDLVGSRAWAGWFEAADPDAADEVRSTLDSVVDELDDDEAVVLSAPLGCQEVDAVLVDDEGELRAELLEDVAVDCDVPVLFAVAFLVALDDVPVGTTGLDPADVVGPGRELDVDVPRLDIDRSEVAYDLSDGGQVAELEALSVDPAELRSVLSTLAAEAEEGETVLVHPQSVCGLSRVEVVVDADEVRLHAADDPDDDALCDIGDPILLAAAIPTDLLPGSD